MAELNDALYQEFDAMIERGCRTRKLRLRWTSALQSCQVGDYWVVPLTTSSDLRKEGAAMRHCVGSQDVLCAMGGYVIFSIRDLDNRRLATMSLFFDQYGWHLEQLKGMENAEVTYHEESFYNGERTVTIREPTELYFVAQEILRQYRATAIS